MKWAELKDAQCLFELVQCFEYRYGVEKDSYKQFEYYLKSAKVGHVGGQKEAGWCLEAGTGTEVDLVEAAKYYKAVAEAGDEDALSCYTFCMNAEAAVDLLNIEKKQ